MIQRAYKFRVYPNSSQQKQLAVEFGHARWIWNVALAARRDAWNWYGESHNCVSLGRAISELKCDPDYAWLKQATAACGQQALIDLDKAYKNWWAKRSAAPRFKRQSHAQSIRYTLDQRKDNYKSGEYLKLPKLGDVKVRWTRLPTGRPKMATVTRDSVGRYWLSFSVEEAVQPMAKTKPFNSVGIDLGIKDVAVTSDGYYSGAPKYTYRYARELKLAQRKLSRKKKGSGRWHRQRKAVARIHSKIANSRSDFLHKLSTKIVTEADVICLENLNVQGMLKNRCLSKAVADVGMFELRRQITYKAEWYGKQVVVIDRWFPSSKACSGCGKKHDMPLDQRQMVCNCGVDLDRDLNAAKNIQAEGVRSLNVDGDTSRTAKPLAA